jgi:hypothetical protein
MQKRFWLSLCWLCFLASFVAAQTKTENVILITLDDARWQTLERACGLNE